MTYTLTRRTLIRRNKLPRYVSAVLTPFRVAR
jgi:hypothetical protein